MAILSKTTLDAFFWKHKKTIIYVLVILAILVFGYFAVHLISNAMAEKRKASAYDKLTSQVNILQSKIIEKEAQIQKLETSNEVLVRQILKLQSKQKVLQIQNDIKIKEAGHNAHVKVKAMSDTDITRTLNSYINDNND